MQESLLVQSKQFMAEPSKSDIDTVLRERFPTMHLVEIAVSVAQFNKNAEMAAEMAATQAAIEAARMELLALSAEQLNAIVANSRARQHARNEQARAKREADDEAKKAAAESARFYNLPGANADFDYWSKADFWTLDEAVALLLGKDPSIVKPAALKLELTQATGVFSLGKPPKPAEFHRTYERLRTLLSRAEALQNARLKPTDVLEWTRRTSAAPVPLGLDKLLGAPVIATSPEQAPSNESLPASERDHDSQGAGSIKRWTPERLEELRLYRERHGTLAASEKFEVSAQRIRDLLPGKPKPPKRAGAFDHLMR